MEKRTNKFTVYYRGQPFDQHAMDAKTLGEALSGFSQAVIAANTMLNGESSPIPDIKVKDEFLEGSFGIEFIVTDYELLKNALEYLGFIISGAAAVTGTVIGLLKKINGQPFTVKFNQQKGGTYTAQLHLSGGEIIECSEEVANLIAVPSIQQGLSHVIYAPLQQEGAEAFEVRESVQDQKPVISIEQENAPAFRYQRKLIKDFQHTIPLTAKAEFTYAGKYKVAGWKAKIDGGAEEKVKISDTEFLEAVQAGKVNAFQNLFKVEVSKTTTNRFGKAETVSYDITKVYY